MVGASGGPPAMAPCGTGPCRSGPPLPRCGLPSPAGVVVPSSPAGGTTVSDLPPGSTRVGTSAGTFVAATGTPACPSAGDAGACLRSAGPPLGIVVPLARPVGGAVVSGWPLGSPRGRGAVGVPGTGVLLMVIGGCPEGRATAVVAVAPGAAAGMVGRFGVGVLTGDGAVVACSEVGDPLEAAEGAAGVAVIVPAGVLAFGATPGRSPGATVGTVPGTGGPFAAASPASARNAATAMKIARIAYRRNVRDSRP